MLFCRYTTLCISNQQTGGVAHLCSGTAVNNSPRYASERENVSYDFLAFIATYEKCLRVVNGEECIETMDGKRTSYLEKKESVFNLYFTKCVIVILHILKLNETVIWPKK